MAEDPGDKTDAVERAASRLLEAMRDRTTCSPVRDLIGSDDIGAAYAVQSRLTRARVAAGAEVVGRKIGLTSPAVQQQLGVDQPDFGVLFDDMGYGHGDVVPSDAVMQPRAEAEIAFVLGKDLAEGPLDAAQVREAVDHAVAALEICGSRIDAWDITLGDTVADNASGGAFILGETRLTLAEFEPREVEMTMSVNDDVVSVGSGAACMGDPIEAVVWLARTARDLGQPLRSGQVILSGALGPMHAIRPGSSVRASIGALGTVGFELGEVQA